MRRQRALGAALAACLALSACAGAHDDRAARRATPSTRAATTSPATTTTLPDIAEIPRPPDVGDDTFRWFMIPAAEGPHVLLAVRRSTATGRHPSVLLPDTSGGFNLDYLAFADALVARGFDVAVGCLYSAPDVLEPGSGRIPCADAPLFDGVADSMVAALDSLVHAAYGALGPSTQLAVMGFSRGAGIAALRASAGGAEPVVLVSGKYEGWNSVAGAVPGGDVNVVDRLDAWRASVLILHGTSDAAVSVSQAQNLEAGLRGIGADVESHYYDGAGHNLAGEPGVRDDLEVRVTSFLCARLTCPR